MMIGIMQGRLVPPDPGRFQSFPRERWQDEFSLATRVPLDYIEWIFDAYGLDVNPIYTENGVSRLQDLVRSNRISIRSVCADYFMDAPFLLASERERAERSDVLRCLIVNANAVGANRIILPFVDASRINSEHDIDTVQQVLESALPHAEQYGVELHLETSLAPEAFARLLERLPSNWIKVNYDSGNSSSLGYAPAEEFAAYGHRIGSVHIKDRLLGGSTVPLGTGDTCFSAVFEGLRRLSYSGDFTLQVARGEPGAEVLWAQQNLKFLRTFWDD